MEANGCRVIFGFPGAAMQKGNMAHGDGEDRKEGGGGGGEVKFSLITTWRPSSRFLRLTRKC